MGEKRLVVISATLLLFAIPANAFAMHIGEGILPFNWCALWFAAAAPFVALGLYKLKKDKNVGRKKPLLGMVAAAIFIVSCMPIPVPTAGTCSHPAGTAMAAILIGPTLQHPCNYRRAAAPGAVFCTRGDDNMGGEHHFHGDSRLLRRVCSLQGAYKIKCAAGRCGLLCRGSSGTGPYTLQHRLNLPPPCTGPGGFYKLFYTIALAFVPTQLPLGILEGFLTAGAVKFLQSRRPELFGVKVLKPATGEAEA